jgi:predicted secreted acid phosphatase
MAKIIYSFNEIITTKEKPLVLCDIDDTILRFNYNIKHFYNEAKLLYPKASNNELVNRAEHNFYIHRNLNKPFHTDLDGFNDLCKRVQEMNGDIMFITARSHGAEDATKKHFKTIGVEYNKFKVHYLSNTTDKGDYVKKNINLQDREEIIFIDDQDYNLDNIQKVLPQIKCFKFVCQ